MDNAITKIPVFIEENDIYTGAKKIVKQLRPDWNIEKINFKLLTDGITNTLLACSENGYQDSNTILVRIYGNKTELLIDRKAETKNILLLHKVGLAPKLYGVFENGLSYQFVPGVTLNVSTVRQPGIYRLVAAHMAKLHKVKVTNVTNPEPVLWKKMQRFLDLVPEEFSDFEKQKRSELFKLPKKYELQQEMEMLKKHISKFNNPTVFAHNDLLLGNVIYTEDENKVTFIDYEYACFNYQGYDIGNHFAEFIGVDGVNPSLYPNEDLQKDWIKHYLMEYLEDENVAESQIEELYVIVNKFALASNLFWGIWCLIQVEHSFINFDFVKYASEKLEEYFSRKKAFLSLELL